MLHATPLKNESPHDFLGQRLPMPIIDAILEGRPEEVREYFASLGKGEWQKEESLILISFCAIGGMKSSPSEEYLKLLTELATAAIDHLCHADLEFGMAKTKVFSLIAVDTGHLPLIDVFIQRLGRAGGSDFDPTFMMDGSVPLGCGYLSSCISAGRADLLDYFLDCGLDPNIEDVWSSALTHKSHHLLPRLFEAGASLYETSGPDPNPPLHRWVIEMDVQDDALIGSTHPALEFLLEKGANLFAVNGEGTAQDCARSRGRHDLVDALDGVVAALKAADLAQKTQPAQGARTHRIRRV